MNETYEVSNLRVHSDMEQVRERSGMFIGDTDDPKQLFNEILDNSLDECQSGYCESIDILCDTKDRTYMIRDYGRGIPIGLMEKEDGTQKEALEVLATKLFSGGKFDNTAYKISGGLHGVGLGCCNALSELFEITTRRDGKSVTLLSERGNNYPVIYSNTVQSNGTTVSFKADEEIFDTSMISTEYIKSRCIIANAFGNKINLYIDGVKVDLPKDTVEELVEIPPEESEYSSTTIKVQLDSGEFMIAVLKYTSSTNSRIDGYTNLLPNRYGGTHVKLLDEAIETAWSEFYSEVNTPLKPSDCKVGLKALVAVFISNPSFNSQTKEKLTTKKKFIQPLMDKFSEEFKSYLIQNPELRLALLKRFEEYRISQNKLTSKKEIMDLVKLNEKVGLHGSTRRKSVVPGLADCTSSSIEGSEEFLVEGDSAGGGAKRARDKKTQAVLPLRGKIKNVAYMSLEDALKSEDVRKIVNSNGAGVGEDCDPERCRYERLNILADADPDGKHIIALIVLAYVHLQANLVKAGRVFVVVPPLYGYTENKVRHFTNDFESIPENLVKSGKFTRYKGLGEMDDDEFEESCLNRANRISYQVQYPQDLDKFYEILGTTSGRRNLLKDLGLIKYIDSEELSI